MMIQFEVPLVEALQKAIDVAFWASAYLMPEDRQKISEELQLAGEDTGKLEETLHSLLAIINEREPERDFSWLSFQRADESGEESCDMVWTLTWREYMDDPSEIIEIDLIWADSPSVVTISGIESIHHRLIPERFK